MSDRGARRDGRRARWSDHRAARRQELILATVQAVRAMGPRAGMDDIAGHAGVSKPVFYRYFSDKADLQQAVGRLVAEVVVRRVSEALGAEVPVRARVAAGIDCYLRLIEGDPELYEYVVHGAPPSRRSAAGTDTVEDYATIVGVQASQVIGAVLRQAGADAGAAEVWGFGVVGMVRAAADRWLAHPTMSRQDLVAYLADLVTPGLLAAMGDGAAVRAGAAVGAGASVGDGVGVSDGVGVGDVSGDGPSGVGPSGDGTVSGDGAPGDGAASPTAKPVPDRRRQP